MDSLRKLLTLVVALCVMLVFATPSFAGGPPNIKQDLRKVTPRRYSYLFSVLGGAALGAGVGAILGSGNALAKGALIGGGGISEMYLTSFPDFATGYRSWGFLLSNTALGAGLGWTLCGCNNGLAAGALVGGGGTAALEAWHAKQNTTTASASQRP
jgi:hypothetical protein